MNTEPEDDLDATAELPQLDLQAAHLKYAADGADATDYLRVPGFDADMSLPIRGAKTSVRPTPSNGDPVTESTGSWPTMDELLSVRDKIVDLEAELLDAELKLAKLDKQHQELLANHVALGVRETEVARDRDRLGADRDLLVESRLQLKQQFEQHQTEAAAGILALQQQLEQLQEQASRELAEHARQRELHEAELAQHLETAQRLSTDLLNEQVQVQALKSDLQATELTQSQQQIAAAALARTLTHELFEKEALRSSLAVRDQRIAALDTAQQGLQTQLDDTEARRVAALAEVEQLQASVQVQAGQITELQDNLRQAERRIARLTEQLESEQGRVRAAEQDKERLTRLAAAEHDTYESTRKELAGRLAELSAVQDQLSQSRAETTSLSKQLADRETLLRGRDELLAAKQQTLQLATENQMAASQREAALLETLEALQEELRQAQAAMHTRAEAYQAAELQIVAERLAKQQLQTQLEVIQEQLQQQQAHQRARDQFILDQAEEMEQLQRTAADQDAQLKRTQAAYDEQRARLAMLEVEQAPLRAEREQQGLLLSKAQQELAAKHAEQGASAKQVEALQQELHQQVEAMNAIRRDIHQVAQQSRYRESDLLVRTLVRMDDESVVHLLNKPVMVIGRAGDTDICVHSESISRRHACLRVGRDVVIVEDLGSTNGCYVNGKRVKRQLLKDGDKLEVGNMKFRFATRVSQN